MTTISRTSCRRAWALPAEPSGRRSSLPGSAAFSLRESEPTPYRPRSLAGALHETFFAAVLVLLFSAVLVLPLHVAANVRNRVVPLIPAQRQSDPAA